MIKDLNPIPSASNVPENTTPSVDTTNPVLMTLRATIPMERMPSPASNICMIAPGNPMNSKVPRHMIAPITKQAVRIVSFIRF